VRKFDSVNVIPFIDILLVLLAIVLTTATFVSNGQLDIDLPDARATAKPDDSLKINLAIDRQEKWYLDDVEVQFEAIELQLAQIDKSTHVYLSVDKAVEFGRFVKLIDLLKTLSLDKVSIATRAIP